MQLWTRLMIGGLLGVCWAGGVSAERVEWKTEVGGNGHFYDAVASDEPISAADAHAAAKKKGGHLATIASRKENDFVFKLIDDEKYWGFDDYGNSFGPWIGGRQDPDAKAVDKGWQWVTGEEWNYTNWSPGAGEPNDSDGVEDHGEDFITFFSFGTTERQDQWNDSFASSPAVVAYLIEWTPKEELEAARAKAAAAAAADAAQADADDSANTEDAASDDVDAVDADSND